MSRKNSSNDDFDSPWKEIIEQEFEAFVAFFHPRAYQQIDWSKGYAFLDKELQQVARGAKTGGRRVDKLVKVTLLNSHEGWVLAHVEVQGQPQDDFAERVFIYHYRIFDKYRRRVASLVILTDTQNNWRPNHYGYELFDCRIGIDFPIVKLLDYRDKWPELEQNNNPFAVVVMAHLKTQDTHLKPQERYEAKIALAKMLYQRGYDRQRIVNLFRFIDWIMALPEELDLQFMDDVTHFEEEQKMAYVTSFERIWLQRGLEQGLERGKQKIARENVVEVLDERFGGVPAGLPNLINQINDLPTLKMLHRKAITIASPAEFEHLLRQITHPFTHT